VAIALYLLVADLTGLDGGGGVVAVLLVLLASPAVVLLDPVPSYHAALRQDQGRFGAYDCSSDSVNGVMRTANPSVYSDHLWASAFLVFGFKSEPPAVQLKAVDMVLFIKKTALPLAVDSFMSFSRCGSALELLKVCTNVPEEVEKSYASRMQDWSRGSLC
jgi:hypothetical protein